MNGAFSPTSYFPSTVDLPGGVTVRLRKSANLVSFCLAMVDQSELGTKDSREYLNDIVAACLAQDEMTLFDRYTFAKRKREWLGGRLAAKAAFLSLADSKLSTENLSTVSILPKESGSPMISSPVKFSNTVSSISISHSGNYAVGMAATAASCGVDIQQISEKTERVADKFCTKDELLLLEEKAYQFSKLEQLNLLWAAKEALKKSLLTDQPTIFQGVKLTSIDIQGETVNLQLVYPEGLSQPATINALRLDEYMLAYTVGDQNHA